MARDLARGVVSLAAGPEGADPASLAWPFGLSAWMRRHGAGPVEVVATLGALRSALLEVGGLEAATEPVPLPVADLTIQVVNGAVYLSGLIGRAASAAGTSPEAVIERALGRLPADVAA